MIAGAAESRSRLASIFVLSALILHALLMSSMCVSLLWVPARTSYEILKPEFSPGWQIAGVEWKRSGAIRLGLAFSCSAVMALVIAADLKGSRVSRPAKLVPGLLIGAFALLECATSIVCLAGDDVLLKPKLTAPIVFREEFEITFLMLAPPVVTCILHAVVSRLPQRPRVPANA